MNKKYLIGIILFLVIMKVCSAQDVAVNGTDQISKVNGGYQVSVTVTPKKATQILVGQIKGKQDNEIQTPNRTLHLIYENKQYFVDSLTFSNVSDLRKYVRTEIRKDLNIN